MDVLVESFSIYIFIAYPYIIKERQIRQWLYYKCWKSRWKDFMCIYIDYIEKKNLSNDQCCFRVDIWGVYTACLSCNNFFFVCFLFFLWMKNSLWGLCMKAAICCTWANNCVYKLWSSLTEYDRAKFLTVSIPNCGLFAFQCFLLCTCKKCVWIKIHQTETHFALKFTCELFLKQNCAESEKQYYFKCRLFKLNAFYENCWYDIMNLLISVYLSIYEHV